MNLLQFPCRSREVAVMKQKKMQRATRLLVIPSISLLVVTVNVIFLLCEVDTAKAFVTPRSTVVVAPSPSFALKVLRSPVQEEIASFNNNRPVVATDANNNSSLDGQTKSSFQLLQESINTNNKKQTFPLLEGLYEKMGTVQDERIIFPEYQAGDVPRIFSSLRYHKSEETGRISAQHATGSVLGAASLVAGTMVGAGVLALPAATAPVGFLPSTAAMGVGWMYMTMSGLLIAELSINRLGQSGKPGKGMLDMYEDSLGPRWSKIGSLAYFGLHYCLLVAYIAQGGANLNALMGMDGWNLPSGVPQASFAGLCALGLFQAPPSVVEKVNNIFVLALSCAFVGILGLGAQTANFASLIDPANQHPEHTLDAFPIIFLSLVYHNIVPTVVNQLEGDRDKITKAIIGGTTIPTLMFLAWNAVVLGNMDPSVTNSIDPVALLQASSGSGNEILSTLVSTFSSLALVTSLIGFVYGLLDGWTDVFKLPTEGPGYEKWKTPLFGLVFLPPLALSLTDPDIFYKALDVGGAFGVSTLFLVLPPIMVWKQRYGEDQQPLMTKPMVPFGKLPLGSMWKAAGTLIVEQGAEKLGVFDWFQHQFLS